MFQLPKLINISLFNTHVDAIKVIQEQKAKKALEEAKARESNREQSGDVNTKVGNSNDKTYSDSDDNHVKKSQTSESSSSEQQQSSASSSSPSTTMTAKQTGTKTNQAGTPTKQRESMKPISTTAVPGTPWCVVWTDKSRVFYFNPSTKTSVWDRPLELRDRKDVDKMVSTPPPILAQINNNNNDNSSSKLENNNKQPLDSQDGDKAEKKVKLDNTASPTTTASTTVPTSISSSLSIAHKASKKEVLTEVEKEAAKKRETIPLEERIATFRQLLEEKQVNPTSIFQKELSKIVFDPRYLLLLSSERKEVFERYCLEKIDEERKKRREKMKKANDDFKSLLNEANLTSRSIYDEFHALYSKDPRYKALEKTKDREILFDDHLAYLRRKERSERSQSHHHHHNNNNF